MKFTATDTYNNLPADEKDVIAFSEAHKEARGFRPRGRAVARFLAKSAEEREEAISLLYEEA